MRRRYRWDSKTGELKEVPWDSVQRSLSAEVWNDLPGYESPIDGRWVEGRKARREDLKRSGCRPYEGFEQESKEAARYRAEQDRQADQLADKMAHRAWAEAPESIRKQFRYK